MINKSSFILLFLVLFLIFGYTKSEEIKTLDTQKFVSQTLDAAQTLVAQKKKSSIERKNQIKILRKLSLQKRKLFKKKEFKKLRKSFRKHFKKSWKRKVGFTKNQIIEKRKN